MKPLYSQALQGTLATPVRARKVAKPDVAGAGDTGFKLKIKNETTLRISLYSLDVQGKRRFRGTLEPGKLGEENAFARQAWVINTAHSDAFITAFRAARANDTVVIDYSVLTEPNNIGEPLAPSATMLIPPDSPRVLVGYGLADNDYGVTREQYWRRSADSFSLPPRSEKVVRVSVTNGMESTSSSLEDISKNTGASLSAGWGPIAASVSASLSEHSSRFQSVTLTEQRAIDVADTFKNDSDKDVVVFRWQLVDVISWIKGGKVREVVSSAQVPMVTRTRPSE